MGRDYEMKWNKFTGTIKSKDWDGDGDLEARITMRPNNEGWECLADVEAVIHTIPQCKSFGPGELEKAHDWCVKQISDHEETTQNC